MKYETNRQCLTASIHLKNKAVVSNLTLLNLIKRKNKGKKRCNITWRIGEHGPGVVMSFSYSFGLITMKLTFDIKDIHYNLTFENIVELET